jgi:hypothetical protein
MENSNQKMTVSEALLAVTVATSEAKPLAIADLKRILGTTIKHDDANKSITFLGMLLTYTEEDQINIGYLAESSTGKSYIPHELSHYFPEEDIIEIGYASPTSFFHDSSKVVKKDKKQCFVVDLHQKILIFMDQPHAQLLERLRPVLSHDKKEIPLLITDRNKNKNLRTKRILIQGFPTVIFASARFNMQDQEKTRLLLLSPETTQEKLDESINLRVQRESDREAFKQSLEKDSDRSSLAQRVTDIKQAKIAQVTVPPELSSQIVKRFKEKHKKLIPRNQRDISRLLALIKAHALLNFDHRKWTGSNIEASKDDVNAGFELYGSISEANELGLSPELYSIYVRLKPLLEKIENIANNGITVTDYQVYYEQQFFRKMSYDVARETLKAFVSMGLLTECTDFNDRRTKRYLLPECVQE